MAATLVVGEIFMLLVPLAYLMVKRVNVKEYVRISFKPKYLAIGLGCGVLLLFVNIIVSGSLTYIFGQSAAVQESNQLLADLATSPTGLAAVAVSLALAGICEEFAFRGFLQNTIFRNMKETKYRKYAFVVSALVAATIFGIFHFDPQGVYILSALISGFVLGYFYYRWNYTVSATAHSTMNIIVLIFLLLAINI
jgi:membrane protease YdiL (CAAX protease family)